MLKTALKKILVLSATIGIAPAALAAGDSLDSLLDEANRALGHRGAETAQPPTAAAPADLTGDAPKAPSIQKKRRPVNKAPEAAPATQQPATSPSTSAADAAKPLQPIDSARVSEILSLDLQAQERERVARHRGIQVRLGAGWDWLPGVYETEKDDDTFRIMSDTTLTGVAAEATAQIPVELPFRGSKAAGTPFWGLSAGAGYFQGDAMVARRGVVTEDRMYPYQLVAADGGLTVGWNSGYQAESAGVRLWITAGYGADIVRQTGDGHFDTFSSVFHGATFAIGSAIRSAGNHEIFVQYRQRGSVRPETNGPDRSSIAGRMLTMGLGIPISG
ncbi:MAG: hypothetical protein RIQ81_2438 [Pseudomonadota bacterium]